MLHRVDTGSDSSFHTQRAVRVNRNDKVIVLGRSNHRFEFFIGKLRVVTTLGERQYPTGHRELDDIAAVLISLSYSFVGIVRAIDHAFFWTRIAAQVSPHPVCGICVTTGGRH